MSQHTLPLRFVNVFGLMAVLCVDETFPPLFASAVCIATFAHSAAIKPTGSDGKPLNLDFETGTLKDWTPQGKAFDQQPVHGDTAQARRNDMQVQWSPGQFLDRHL